MSIMAKRLTGFGVFLAMGALFVWHGHTIWFYAGWAGIAMLYALFGYDRQW